MNLELINQLREYKVKNVSDSDIIAVTGLQSSIVKIFPKFDELFRLECDLKIENINKNWAEKYNLLKMKYDEDKKIYDNILSERNQFYFKDKIKDKEKILQENKKLKESLIHLESLNLNELEKKIFDLENELKSLKNLKEENKILKMNLDSSEDDLIYYKEKYFKFRNSIPKWMKFLIKDD